MNNKPKKQLAVKKTQTAKATPSTPSKDKPMAKLTRVVKDVKFLNKKKK